jgi:hypothetical protein
VCTAKSGLFAGCILNSFCRTGEYDRSIQTKIENLEASMVVSNPHNTIMHRQRHNHSRRSGRIQKFAERQEALETLDEIDEKLDEVLASQKESGAKVKDLRARRKEVVAANGGIKKRGKGKADRGKPIPSPADAMGADISGLQDTPGLDFWDGDLDPALEPITGRYDTVTRSTMAGEAGDTLFWPSTNQNGTPSSSSAAFYNFPSTYTTSDYQLMANSSIIGPTATTSESWHLPNYDENMSFTSSITASGYRPSHFYSPPLAFNHTNLMHKQP